MSNEENGAPPTESTALLEDEMEKAKNMSISELKMTLMAQGVLTSTFCEKSEFVRAYAETMVAKANRAKELVDKATNGSDEDDDEDHHGAEEGDIQDDDEEEDPTADLPFHVKQRVLKLKELHNEREGIMSEYLVERAQLEAKYQKRCKPLLDKRSEIVKGNLDEEIAQEFASKVRITDKESTSAKEEEEQQQEEEDLKGVPQFWVVALSHNDTLAQLITEQDVACLEYLQDVTCEDDENGQGFTLRFFFAPQNEYFHDTMLTKRYDVPNLLSVDEPLLKNVEGCKIQWKAGKSLTTQKVSKQQRGTGKNKGQVRFVTASERADSFFHWFQPPKIPSMEMMNAEIAEKLEQDFDADYEVAQAFRNQIIPKAVVWFAGQVRIVRHTVSRYLVVWGLPVVKVLVFVVCGSN
jgi:nucleosome assembly protein 1-like 1